MEEGKLVVMLPAGAEIGGVTIKAGGATMWPMGRPEMRDTAKSTNWCYAVADDRKVYVLRASWQEVCRVLGWAS